MEVKFEEKVIAQTPYFTEFENKIYFPLDSIVSKYVKKTTKTSQTEQGKITFYDIIVNETTLESAAYSFESTNISCLENMLLFTNEQLQPQKITFFKKIYSWLYLKRSIFAAGTGFLSDAYDLFVISNVMLIMKKIYNLTPVWSSFISSSALVGAIIGQLFFGILSDRLGRKFISIATIILVLLGCILSAFCFDGILGTSIFLWLGISRFILGVGVGGEYPLSATIASESSTDKKSKDSRVAMVFSMQGFGSLMSAIVVLVLLSIFPNHLDIVWRFALGFGAVPAIIAFVFRVIMEETHEFKTIQKTSFWEETVSRISIIWNYHKLDLLGTTMTWLIFDITFYANGIFVPTVINIIGLGGPFKDVPQELIYAAGMSSIIAVIAIPGYIISSLTITKLGRKNIQLFGFGMIAIIYVIMGTFYKDLTNIPAIFIILYGLTFFFSNFGPNVSTYVLPAVTYSAKIRATCSGISAAAGKLGAVIGSSIVNPLVDSRGVGQTLSIFGVIAITGLLATVFWVKEKSLEELENENKIEKEENKKEITEALMVENLVENSEGNVENSEEKDLKIN